MKRIFGVIAAVLLLLSSSCATRSLRPQPLPFTLLAGDQAKIITLTVGKEELLGAGYREGDWIDLHFEEVVLRVLYAREPVGDYPTLVAYASQSTVFLPTAIATAQEGLLTVAQPERRNKTSLHLSGSFVFTL